LISTSPTSPALNPLSLHDALPIYAAASKGNDQVRMETALAALDPRLRVLAPVREWNLKNLEDKLIYARRRRLPIEEPKASPVTVDRKSTRLNPSHLGISYAVFRLT